MGKFLVTWQIDVEAKNHREAAKRAQKIMREPEDWYFKVKERGGNSVDAVGVDLAVAEEGDRPGK